MPTIDRPDGATIYYEVHGSGHPLLLFAPGGVSSQVEFWDRSAFNPIAAFSDSFMVIAMDQRHAGRSPAPAKPFSYDETVADQVAVLDDVGVQRAHVMGGCIGCAYALRLVHDAPGRVSAAVLQDPVGLDGTNTPGTFYAMFHETMRLARAEGMSAIVAAGRENGLFVVNNGAGPFSQRIHDDPGFAAEIERMPVESYVALVVRFRDGIWPPGSCYFTVPEDWVATCPVPLLVLPGSDQFHPTGIAHRLCREAPRAQCLDIDCRSPEKRQDTVNAVRAFLRENAPG
jgi:pimeloyl-ACP methyl ester carboxylesterase